MRRTGESFMRACGYTGILAVELFVKGDRFWFNEMAPRPHNSGHWTIEGCTTNQFRELVRYLAGLPLEEPRLQAPAVMKTFPHPYRKSESRPQRKMGHVTFVGTDAADYAARWAGKFVQ